MKRDGSREYFKRGPGEGVGGTNIKLRPLCLSVLCGVWCVCVMLAENEVNYYERRELGHERSDFGQERSDSDMREAISDKSGVIWT